METPDELRGMANTLSTIRKNKAVQMVERTIASHDAKSAALLQGAAEARAAALRDFEALAREHQAVADRLARDIQASQDKYGPAARAECKEVAALCGQLKAALADAGAERGGPGLAELSTFTARLEALDGAKVRALEKELKGARTSAESTWKASMEVRRGESPTRARARARTRAPASHATHTHTRAHPRGTGAEQHGELRRAVRRGGYGCGGSWRGR